MFSMIVLLVMFFIATVAAIAKSAQAFGVPGVLLAITMQAGVFGGVVVLEVLGYPIPYGIGIPVVTGIFLFRRAQTAIFIQIANAPDEEDDAAGTKVADIFE